QARSAQRDPSASRCSRRGCVSSHPCEYSLSGRLFIVRNCLTVGDMSGPGLALKMSPDLVGVAQHLVTVFSHPHIILSRDGENCLPERAEIRNHYALIRETQISKLLAHHFTFRTPLNVIEGHRHV